MEKKQGLFINALYNKMSAILDKMAEHPETVTEEEQDKLGKLYSLICKTLGISEHSQWRCTWEVFKWAETARKLAGFACDDYACETQNIILDVGANEILRVIAGTGGQAYDANNAYIYVGTDTTREAADQTGIIATGVNRAYAGMDIGYPVVNGRQAIYRGSFGDNSANFKWQESSIVNGTGTNAVAMNRKVANLGEKVTGTWTLQITLSIVSA